MKQRRNLRNSWLFVLVLLVMAPGCEDPFTPKPSGFFRIDLPKKIYRTFESDCPFEFDYPEYALVMNHNSETSMPCWLNIEYPTFQGTLHLSYFDIVPEGEGGGTIKKYLEDARNLAMKHTVKAHAIEEELIYKRKDKVYGIVYNIEGLNTASSVQFYMTDSTDHFLRGALYFNVAPRNDSLAPVIKFIKADVSQFIKSFSWKTDEKLSEGEAMPE